MKLVMALVSLFAVSVGSVGFAQEAAIKECSVEHKRPDSDKIHDIKIQIFSKPDHSLYAKLASPSDSSVHVSLDEADFFEGKVREGLSSSTSLFGPEDESFATRAARAKQGVQTGQDSEELNLAERLVVHAMKFTENQTAGSSFSAGLELSKIRSAKVYRIGSPRRSSFTAIIEARGADQNLMGSFYGGFYVLPCK